MPTRLLVIGDIHLGRQSSRLPDGLDPAALDPAAALRQAARTAHELKVSAVLLAGDIADQTRDQYHALGVLTEVLTPLLDAGIAVLAVAGNHDHEVLPRLERAVPGLQILGRGGVWQLVTLQGTGGAVRVLGWSFPGEHHAASPALGLPVLEPGPPTVGLLHADLDATSSRYAPVRRHELAQAGRCRWLLGHVHAPSLDPANDQPGYLGSLMGLDPTETGPRGPWLVEVNGNAMSLRFLPQGPLRWDALTLAVDPLAAPRDDLPGLVADALRRYAVDNEPDLAGVSAVGLRLRLTGRTPDHPALVDAVAQLTAARHAQLIAPGVTAFIDRIDLAAQPAHDLAALAERDDPPGLLARELVALRDGQAQALLAAAGKVIRGVDTTSNMAQLIPGDDLPADTLTDLLLQSGYRILDDLLAARRDRHGPA